MVSGKPGAVHSDKNTLSPPKNKIDKVDFFSPDSIANKYISDNDIKVFLNNEYIETKSAISQNVLRQILERKFLKPLWKTIYDYNLFMRENFNDRTKRRIESDINDSSDNDKNIRKIVNLIISNTSVNHSDVFLIKRSNKFYSMSKSSEFYIDFEKHGDVELDKIFPERKFEDNYTETAFYLFTLESKMEEVKLEFIRIMKDSTYKK